MKLTPEEARRLYADEHYSLALIGTAHDLSTHQVKGLLAQTGTPLRYGPIPRAWLPDERGIEALYEAYGSVTALADLIGTSKYRVVAALEDAGVEFRRKKELPEPGELVRMWTQFGLWRLHLHLGVNQNRLRNALKDAGATEEQLRRGRRPPSHPLDPHIEDVRARREAGETYAQIGAAYGLRYTRVRNFVHSRIGAKPNLTSEQRKDIRESAQRGEPRASLARRYGVSLETIGKIINAKNR